MTKTLNGSFERRRGLFREAFVLQVQARPIAELISSRRSLCDSEWFVPGGSHGPRPILAMYAVEQTVARRVSSNDSERICRSICPKPYFSSRMTAGRPIPFDRRSFAQAMAPFRSNG